MKRWIGIAMMVLVLAGCGGGGGGDGEPLEPPEFDLTGRWVATEVDCTSDSSDVPQSELARFDAEYEASVLYGSGLRVIQMGNDLEITYLDDDTQVDGTISGDQIRYTVSEQQTIGDFDVSMQVEAEGTALDADRVVITLELDWTFRVQGRSITGDTSCTGRLMRLDEPPDFHLTGRWRYEEIDCTSFSTHLPQDALAELDGQLEYEILQNLGVRIRQTGNDLEITYLDDDTQVDGTISGDQLRYTVSEQQTLVGFAIDVYLEAEGTALDANTIAGTENLELTFEAEGEAVTVSTVCTGRLMRVVEG